MSEKKLNELYDHRSTWSIVRWLSRQGFTVRIECWPETGWHVDLTRGDKAYLGTDPKGKTPWLALCAAYEKYKEQTHD
jgi:hypothetical protein